MRDQDVETSQNKPQRDAAAVRVFPPAVPLATILSGLALQHIWPLGSAYIFPALMRYALGGTIILFSIYFLGFRAVSTMRRSGQSENPYKKTTEIIESGPFRVTRNPMYLQMVLVCFGFAILLSNFWILILTPICAVLLHFLVILPEERYLERKFGENYLAYKTRVRRWI